jgi:hypothetical protein
MDNLSILINIITSFMENLNLVSKMEKDNKYRPIFITIFSIKDPIEMINSKALASISTMANQDINTKANLSTASPHVPIS